MLENTGKKVLYNVPITFGFNQQLYKIVNPAIEIPMLVPNNVNIVDVTVQCIVDSAGSDSIRIFVCNPKSPIPLITYIVQMPISELFFENM
jgi:hypothetical protein